MHRLLLLHGGGSGVRLLLLLLLLASASHAWQPGHTQRPALVGGRGLPCPALPVGYRRTSRCSSSESASSISATPTVVADDDEALPPPPPGVGLYHAFAQAAWSQLTDTGWFDSDSSNSSLVEQQRWAPAKGMPAGSLVQMTVRGQRSSSTNSPVAYARYALLETLVPRGNDTDDGDTSTTTTHVQGVQVLNFVIIPALDSTLPVWGADFVALPGGKHLLLLDAQPMVGSACEAHTAFTTWYEEFDIGGAVDDDNDNTTTNAPKAWPWAGDLPPAVTQYVSPKALWTRLAVNSKDDDDATTKTPTDQIQHDLLPAMETHLNIYLQLLADAHGKETPVDDNDPTSALPAYLDYRRANDPARPMLQSLYGKEWTEEILNTVLFPELFGDDDKAL